VIRRREFLLGSAAALAALRCKPAADARYDLCIIGSGFAGTTLALRAAARGLHTLLLEAGGDLAQAIPGLEDEFQFENRGAIAYPLERSRVIALGGGSNHWSGTLNRMRPSDFRERSEFGLHADWPIAYADLETWYCEAERELWATGFAPVPNAEPARQCAYPHQSSAAYRMPEIRYAGEAIEFFPVAESHEDGRGATLRLIGTRIPELRAQASAEIVSGEMAVELVPASENQIECVRALDRTGGEKRYFARRFVVAAGVVETARLLLRSRSPRFPAGIGNTHDLVGRHFMEHPTFQWTVPTEWPDSLPRGVHRTYHFSDAFRKQGLNGIHYQVHVESEGSVIWKLQPEMSPRPGSRVRLSKTQRDRFGEPLPALVFSTSRRDLRTLDAGLPFVREQLRALGFAPRELPRERRWRYHPGGTCRMAADERNGVVDRDGRVFGIDNLYVAGASTFPTAGTANPTLTVVALALRLADHLISRA
jgi:choline dehydrogenase-like flavoprotein